jgi:hypothetical protein
VSLATTIGGCHAKIINIVSTGTSSKVKNFRKLFQGTDSEIQETDPGVP